MQTTFDSTPAEQYIAHGDPFPDVDLISAVDKIVVEAILLARLLDVQACARHLVTALSPLQLYLMQEPPIVSAIVVHVAEKIGLAEVYPSGIMLRNQSDKGRIERLNRFLRDLTPIAEEETDTAWEDVVLSVWDVLSSSDLALGPIGWDYDFAGESERATTRAIAEAVARFVVEE